MEKLLEGIIVNLSLPAIFLIIAASLYTLSKGADILVTNAVSISERLGIPKMIIGATIVSLGTTLPETSVSVLAAINGNADLALGNAVGSIICDTALILGIASLISPLPLKKEIVNRHGWIQLGSGIVLVLLSLPYSNIKGILTEGGHINQLSGFLLLILLAAYIYISIKWTRNQGEEAVTIADNTIEIKKVPIFLKLVLGMAVVIISSKVLIPAVTEVALRMKVPNSIIAATLVAFGTSLPELVTAITATLKGHGELAVGNIIGADILNVLFVMGSATAVTKGGITVQPEFFTLYFPAMLFVLAIFRIGTIVSKDSLKRPFGFVLLASYILVTVISYV